MENLKIISEKWYIPILVNPSKYTFGASRLSSQVYYINLKGIGKMTSKEILKLLRPKSALLQLLQVQLNRAFDIYFRVHISVYV